MASQFTLGSSLLPSFPSVNPKSRTRKSPQIFFISCQQQKPPNFDNDDKINKTYRTQLDFLAIPLTLFVVSSSLPGAALAAVKTEKKKSQKKPQEALSPEQLKLWSQNLPIVSNRVPYSDILRLKEEGRLKHVIKPPGACLKERPEAVLVVVGDDKRVLRTVLPSIESDKRFWDFWDGTKIDAICVNAYTPPLKRPEVPKPYLGFLWKVPEFMLSWFKPKKESKRVLEIRKMREELKRERKEELEKMRREREMMEKAFKLQKKEEERRIKREMRRRKYEESLSNAQRNYTRMGNMWADMAQDSTVVSALGLAFFVIFYRTVVFSYRRQKKDYEDRLKIEKAEAEERKKMRELEGDVLGLENEEDGNEQGKGEQNPYMKMAMQFMKSGARIRRARNKRLPQYLERDVDVKFTDVAGLGKIRLELEEIVKFFTHGEMYRRRGVRIPG